MLTQKIFAIAQNGAEVVLWVLLLMSIISIAIILERFLTLRGVRSRSQRVQGRMREAIQAYNLQEIEELSKDREALEGRALSYALRHIKESGSNGIEELFNSYSLIEKQGLEKFLNFLATVGSNAPFIGLLGTVLGIMKAFNDLSVTQAADNHVVMAGIAEALVSTAVGLLVAIPAVIAYNVFQRQVRGILASLDSVKELCVVYAKKRG